MYLAAVVPTIDEAETIGGLVKALDKMCDLVIVVDDSKTTQTLQAAIDASAEAGEGIGSLGGAYYVGADHLARPEWHVLHIDAGGSHDPADVYPMIELAEEGFDVVIGSRFCPGGEHHGSWKRKVTSRMAAGALNLISLQDYSDWTSGFRIYSPRARQILAQHTFTTTGHAWQIESLHVLIAHGMRIVETPVIYRSSASHLSRGRVAEAASLFWRLART